MSPRGLNEKTDHNKFSVFYCCVLYIIGLGIGHCIQEYANRDKFKAGDIVEAVYETEFTREVRHNYIKKVGKKYYLVDVKVKTDDGVSTSYDQPVLKHDLNYYDRKGE